MQTLPRLINSHAYLFFTPGLLITTALQGMLAMLKKAKKKKFSNPDHPQNRINFSGPKAYHFQKFHHIQPLLFV